MVLLVVVRAFFFRRLKSNFAENALLGATQTERAGVHEDVSDHDHCRLVVLPPLANLSDEVIVRGLRDLATDVPKVVPNRGPYPVVQRVALLVQHEVIRVAVQLFEAQRGGVPAMRANEREQIAGPLKRNDGVSWCGGVEGALRWRRGHWLVVDLADGLSQHAPDLVGGIVVHLHIAPEGLDGEAAASERKRGGAWVSADACSAALREHKRIWVPRYACLPLSFCMATTLL